MVNLEGIATEKRNISTLLIDELSTIDMLTLINNEDKTVPLAIEKILPDIAMAVDLITKQLQSGGRLFYIGAGTSGRLGVLDAAECPPTYGVSPDLVQGIIAGGAPALLKAQEGAEDSLELCKKDLKEKDFSQNDIMVGIAASGRTPYVIGGLEYAKSIGAPTISIACSPKSEIAKLADIPLTVVTGPEVITGSTRMKAGTAQKLVLNMLSTGTMIKLGKVYSNLMVDLMATNRKLEERSIRIVMEATGENREISQKALAACKGKAKTAIFMLLSGLTPKEATTALDNSNGFVSKALNKLKELK